MHLFQIRGMESRMMRELEMPFENGGRSTRMKGMQVGGDVVDAKGFLDEDVRRSAAETKQVKGHGGSPQ